MGSIPAKQPRMNDHEINEPTQTSPHTTEIGKPDTSFSCYDYHYNQPFYADKTLLIKELFKIDHVLVTAPSRFGKTLNMDMVRRFVKIELDKDDKPIDVIQGSSFKEILTGVRRAINMAFQEHPYLQESSLWSRPGFDKEVFMKYFDLIKFQSLNENELKCGLQILSKLLHGYYGRKVFVFIDEFDVPVKQMIYKNAMKPKRKQKMIDLLQMMVKNLLEGNKFVEKSLLNACQQFGGILLGRTNNVKFCAFLQEHMLNKFYGFEPAEVKELLKMVGRVEDFNFIKLNYSGYKSTSKDGRNIEIYSSWAVLQNIIIKYFNVDWSAGIRIVTTDRMCHFKIRPIISDIMSGKSVTIRYVEKFEIKHIDMLFDIFYRNKVDEEEGADLFIQLLYEEGFFYPTALVDNCLTLAVPNAGVYSKINEILYKGYFQSICDNHPCELVKNFIDSLNSLGQSCDKKRARALARSIDALFKSGQPPQNEFEFQSILHGYMYRKFKCDNDVCTSYISTRSDLLLVMRPHHFGCIFKFKFSEDKKITSNEAHTQIIENEYYILLEEASLKTLFRHNTPTIENRIYLGIHMDKNDGKVSITYSSDNKKPRTVDSSA
ncbi:hypothetical protein PV326_013010 [Microctonus aethiopoides]|nr:hypothetical protein PV326_013010 [Microctonus aethiopoides]